MNYSEWKSELLKKLHTKYGNEVIDTMKNSNISNALHQCYKNNTVVDDAVLFYDTLIKNKDSNVFWIA